MILNNLIIYIIKAHRWGGRYDAPYDKGIKIYDQFGTIGDLSENNKRLGLHEFKKKFGGDYIEFIGEFDLVNKKIITCKISDGTGELSLIWFNALFLKNILKVLLIIIHFSLFSPIIHTSLYLALIFITSL